MPKNIGSPLASTATRRPHVLGEQPGDGRAQRGRPRHPFGGHLGGGEQGQLARAADHHLGRPQRRPGGGGEAGPAVGADPDDGDRRWQLGHRGLLVRSVSCGSAGLRVCGPCSTAGRSACRRRRSADEGVAGAAYLAVHGHHPVRVHAPVAAVSVVRGRFSARRRAPCPSQRFRTPPTTPGPGRRATSTRSRLAGSDPDLHRQDLWEAVEGGDHPSWTLYVQAMPFDGALASGVGRP